MTLVLFAIILSASAQTELPPIDEAEAAPLLGRWYLNDVCADGTCVNFPELGITLTYDVNPDNTILVGAETGTPDVNKWYMENGTAYTIVTINETAQSVSEFGIDENGMLVAKNDSGYVTYTRELQTPAASEEAAADASSGSFTGEWHIKGIMLDGSLVPAALLGSDSVLTITDTEWNLIDGESDEGAEYIMEDGKLYSILEGTDPEGNPWEEDVMFEYRDDGSLYLYFAPGTESEFIMVFTREKNVTEAQDTVDAQGAAEPLTPDGEANGDTGIGGLLESLLGETDLSGLVSSFPGAENLDINGLISGLMSGDGEGFNLSGLLDQLTGGAEGEGGFDFGSLMNMFGSGE